MKIKYFIIKYINLDKDGKETEMYDCRVVNEDYKEIYKNLLNKEDKNAFLQILCSNQGALLYRNQENLKDLAYFEIDNKLEPFDGTKYP